MLHSCFPHWRSEHVQEKRLIWGVENPAAKTEPDPAEKPDDTEVDPRKTDEQLKPEEGAKESPAGPREGDEEPVEAPEDLSKKGVDAAGKAMERPQANNEKAQRVAFESQLDFVNSPDEKNRLVNMYDQMPPMQKRITVLAVGGIEGNDKKMRFVELMGKFSPEHNTILQKVAGGIEGQAAFLERVVNGDREALIDAGKRLTPQEMLQLQTLRASITQEAGDAELLKEGLRKAAEQQKEQHGDQLAESFAKFLTMLSEFMEKIMKFFQDIEKAMKGEYHKGDGKDGGAEKTKSISPEARRGQIEKRLPEIDKRLGEIDGDDGELNRAARNLQQLKDQKVRYEGTPPADAKDIPAHEEGMKILDGKISQAEQKVQQLKDEQESLGKEKKQLAKELDGLGVERKPSKKGTSEEEKKTETPEKLNAGIQKRAEEMVAITAKVFKREGVELSVKDQTELTAALQARMQKLPPEAKRKFLALVFDKSPNLTLNNRDRDIIKTFGALNSEKRVDVILAVPFFNVEGLPDGLKPKSKI